MFNFLKTNISDIDYKDYNTKSHKHFPSSVREWNDSIYSYNKNTTDLIPSNTNLSIKLLKNYFTFFNFFIERKLRARNLRSKFRKLSTNKIYIGDNQFKHTNNKVIITLYVFNRQKQNYIFSTTKKYFSVFFNSRKNKSLSYSFFKRYELIRNKSLYNLKKSNLKKYVLLKTLKSNERKKLYVYLSKYVNNYYIKFINKSFKIMKLYFLYRQMIFINKSKFNYNFLQYIKISIQELYNKNVEFNLVDLKRFYLDSNIMSESLSMKVTKNRKNITKHLAKLKNKIRIKTDISPSLLKNKNILQKKNSFNEYSLEKNITESLKYRHISGFRIEVKGRLNRRYTASRSVIKMKHKGNLLNIDSSFRGLSSVLLKGNLKSNIQNSKLKSQSRVGAFGIKGWISGT